MNQLTATEQTSCAGQDGQWHNDRYEVRTSPPGQWGSGIWDRRRDDWACTGLDTIEALHLTDRMNDDDAYDEEDTD